MSVRGRSACTAHYPWRALRCPGALRTAFEADGAVPSPLFRRSVAHKRHIGDGRVKALLRTAVGLSVAASLALGVATSPAFGASRTTIDDFMTGLACVESSGRYNALNVVSGSYGKYQI